MKIKQKLLFLLLGVLLPMLAQAQELTVKSMEMAPMDISASQYSRNDKNGNACALVKVQLAAAGAEFAGNVLGDCAYKTGEYWVYMSQGSYQLKIRHPNFVPLTVNFRDYGIRSVESKATYVLTLLKPQGVQEVKKQKLIINYTPKDAMVLIDSKPYPGSGHVEIVLPLGEHSYMIAANGYITAEGMVKLNGGSQRVINETLEKEVAESIQSAETEMAGGESNLGGKHDGDDNIGTSEESEEKLAEEWYRKGVECNNKKDYVKAAEWYLKAAKVGHAQAQNNLGALYVNGNGVEKNLSKAIEWYQKAADKGNVYGLTNLAIVYQLGNGVPKDMNKAIELFTIAANKGHSSAQFRLGAIYNDLKDYESAAKWYQEAADKGNASAQINLGALYNNGQGVAQDYKKAVEWYQKSADQGNVYGENSLGYMYEKGRGLPQSYTKAAEWYQRAADKGYKVAINNLKRIQVFLPSE